MNHPAEGVLRRLHDEPSGVALSDRRHVHDCSRCRDDLAGIRQDADLVGAALAPAGGPDVDAAAACCCSCATRAHDRPQRSLSYLYAMN